MVWEIDSKTDVSVAGRILVQTRASIVASPPTFSNVTLSWKSSSSGFESKLYIFFKILQEICPVKYVNLFNICCIYLAR